VCFLLIIMKSNTPPPKKGEGGGGFLYLKVRIRAGFADADFLNL